MKRILLPFVVLAMASPALAQVNAKGTLQFGLGLGLGGHATHFESELSFLGSTQRHSNRDGAVTFTVPIEAQVGLSDRFSVGLHVEPGSYLDSAGTHPNKLFILGLSPRFYAVNKDRFALYFNADFGFSKLLIGDVRNGVNRYDDRYAGAHFRLGVATQWYFGDVIGIHLGLKYAAHSLKWKAREPSDQLLNMVDYSAKLKTSGVQFQVGLQVKI